MGPKAAPTIEIIKGRMRSQGPWNLGPQCITATVPDVDITNVKLPEPNYTKGQEVATIIFRCIRSQCKTAKIKASHCLFLYISFIKSQINKTRYCFRPYHNHLKLRFCLPFIRQHLKFH